jgi:hypothetical protein
MSDVAMDDEVIEASSGPAGMLVTNGGMTAVVRAEIDMQITTARAYPRRPTHVRNSLVELVTLDDAAAEESMYALPRAGKPVTGPSIRFAESVKQAWGNCRASAEISEVNKIDKYVEAIGIFHDLETNTVTRITHRRRISGKSGKLFPDDMIMVTANAACSVAMRESILKGVPKPVWRAAYEAVLKVIAGDVMTLAVNREKAIKAFAVYGVKPDQVFAAIGVLSEADITLEHITVLRGMFSALKNGEETVESMFAKREKESDANYNPLVKAERTDPATGEVTNSQATTGGANEVAKGEKDPTRLADASASENRSAGAQEGTKAGEKPATESGAGAPNEVERRSEGSADHANGTEPSGKTPSSAETNGLTGASSGGGENRPLRQDLLSDHDAPSGGKGEPAHPRQTEGAGDSRGEKPPAPDRLRSYSKALLNIESGGPAKLIKQSDAWARKYSMFEGADEAKRKAVYDLHLNRITGAADIATTKAKVEEIIGK